MNQENVTSVDETKEAKRKKNLRRKLAKIASNPNGVKLRTKVERLWAKTVMSSESRKANPKPRARTVSRKKDKLNAKLKVLSNRLDMMNNALLNKADLRPFRVKAECKFEDVENGLRWRIKDTHSKLRNLTV